MKNKVLMVCGIIGLVTTVLTGAKISKEPGYVSETGSIVEAKYQINAFQPSKTDYNMNHYNAVKMGAFLKDINDLYQNNQIIEVDGLKWKKESGEWMPFPNPPMPVLKPGGDVLQYTKQYAKWIDDHPHFSYPPLPFDKEELKDVTY